MASSSAENVRGDVMPAACGGETRKAAEVDVRRV